MLLIDRETLPSLPAPVRKISAELVGDEIEVNVEVGGDEPRCWTFDAPRSDVDHTAWFIKDRLTTLDVSPADEISWRAASTDAARRVAKFFCTQEQGGQWEPSPFEDVAYERDSLGLIIGAEANCIACGTRHWLKASPFGGGVHLRCLSCGTGQTERFRGAPNDR
jgi:hypothetical protein